MSLLASGLILFAVWLLLDDGSDFCNDARCHFTAPSCDGPPIQTDQVYLYSAACMVFPAFSRARLLGFHSTVHGPSFKFSSYFKPEFPSPWPLKRFADHSRTREVREVTVVLRLLKLPTKLFSVCVVNAENKSREGKTQNGFLTLLPRESASLTLGLQSQRLSRSYPTPSEQSSRMITII